MLKIAASLLLQFQFAQAYQWGLPAYRDSTKEVLFSGILKDDQGAYHYDRAAKNQYQVEAPTNCGIFRMTDGKVGLTLPTHYTVLDEQTSAWDWDHAVAMLELAKESQIVSERKIHGHLPWISIRIDRLESVERLTAELSYPDDGTVQATDMQGTADVLVINFDHGKPVSVESRHYINPKRPNQPDWNIWPSGIKHNIRVDENGRRYYRDWACENDVLS